VQVIHAEEYHVIGVAIKGYSGFPMGKACQERQNQITYAELGILMVMFNRKY
jgi:hypothetical protein